MLVYPRLLWALLWLMSEELEQVESTLRISRAVETSQGRVRGLTAGGVDRFYGIPYATCQRFQPPQPPPVRHGVFLALRRFGHCAQAIGGLTLGREDCLDLDIHSPLCATGGSSGSSGTTDLRPVLVFIHGGAYYYGSKAHYDPEFLVKKNVVVVIINYRVGVLGFLCANDVANLGLKDQVAALKWIRDNIAAFGGDPDNVTISGQSAGASAAAMHLLSQSSKGLFHKAILMSGTPMTPWAFNVEPLRPALEDVRKISPAETEADIINTFANTSVNNLLAATKDVSTNTRYFKYSPCVDSNLTEPFFHDTPLNTIRSGRFNKVPMIVGSTDVEGMLFYGINSEQSFKKWNDNFTEHLPSLFSHLPGEERRVIADKLRSHYFGTKAVNSAAVKSVVNYYSDWLIYSTIGSFMDLMSRHSDQPVYRYLFAYEGWRNFAKLFLGWRTGLGGASHSDDIFYVFKPAGLTLPMARADQQFIEKLTTMITDFMKFGDPTPARSPVHWQPWSPGPSRSTDPSGSTGPSRRVLRLARRLSMGAAPPPARLMHALLCRYSLPGYIACDTDDP